VESRAKLLQAKARDAYARIREDLEFLVMVTPTGKAREDLTSARIYIERARQHEGRSRV
jgi:hypothetical protein